MKLGCIPDTPDPVNDFKYAEKARISSSLVTLPSKFSLASRYSLPMILDQGNLGSCTGHGIARALRSLLRKKKLPEYAPSRLFIYYGEREIEGSVNSDSGAAIRDGMKFVAQTGVCEERLWPYLTSRFRVKPSEVCYENATFVHHRNLQYLRLENNSSQLRTALYDNGAPIVIGFSVYSNFYDIGSNGMMPMPAGDMLGGHCVTIDGYNDETRHFLCANSWGSSWGDRGYFRMPYDVVNNPDMGFDLWCLTSI